MDVCRSVAPAAGAGTGQHGIVYSLASHRIDQRERVACQQHAAGRLPRALRRQWKVVRAPPDGSPGRTRQERLQPLHQVRPAERPARSQHLAVSHVRSPVADQKRPRIRRPVTSPEHDALLVPEPRKDRRLATDGDRQVPEAVPVKSEPPAQRPFGAVGCHHHSPAYGAIQHQPIGTHLDGADGVRAQPGAPCPTAAATSLASNTSRGTTRAGPAIRPDALFPAPFRYPRCSRCTGR